MKATEEYLATGYVRHMAITTTWRHEIEINKPRPTRIKLCQTKKKNKMDEKTAVLGGNIPVTESWLRKHRPICTGATRHPFILSIRDGSVDFSSFKKWLGQDFIFVRAFVPFVASVLVKAWKESDDGNHDVEILLGGIASLNDELEWFKKEASRFHVSLTSVIPHKTNVKYCRFLESLTSSETEYAVAIAAFWAIETVYQESFAHCLEEGSRTPEELIGTCQRWGNEGFGQYCKSLETIVNRCLDKASVEVISKAEVVFLKVLEHEVDFWNMSRGEP